MDGKGPEALCEAAWAALERCVELVGKTGRPRNKTPFAYVQESLEKLRALGAKAAAEACACAGPDALTLARWLGDALSSLSLVLRVAEECIASESDSALLFTHVAAQRLEHRLLRLLDLLGALRQGRAAAIAPEELLGSGDLLLFWRDYFPRRLRVRCSEFVQVLRETRGLESGACEELLPWLQLRSQEGELELADVAIVLDSVGLSRGIAFCTRWEELCGHAFLAAVLSQGGRGGASASAADLVLARREQESSVLFAGLSRAALRGNCALLRSLMVLGAVLACDSDDGLLVQFQEKQVASLLVRQPALGEALAAAAQTSNLGLGPPKANTASARMARLVEKYRFQHAHDRHQFLALLKAKKLYQLDDFLCVFEILGVRQRAVMERRVRACDPSLQSEAWPKLQQSMRDQKAMEEQVLVRKQTLRQMEHAVDHPDQISQIRELLQEVADAEAEHDRNRKWLEEQMKAWRDEDETFNSARFYQDMVCRQRVAAMLIDMYLRQQQRLALQAELARIETLLIDLDESFAASRQRLHDHDQRLAAAIRGRDEYLSSITQVVAAVKGQMLEADGGIADRQKEQQCLQRILELQAAKLHHLDEIDVLERRLDSLRGRHNPAQSYPAGVV